MSNNEPYSFAEEELSAVPDRYREDFEYLVQSLPSYGRTGSSDDEIRELMQRADSLFSTYTDEEDELPDALDRLDDQLWEWFQEPPDEETFKETFGELLETIHTVLTADESAGETAESTPDGDAEDPDSSVPPSLEEMDYRELQTLAKQHDIKANQSTEALREALSEERDNSTDDQTDTGLQNEEEPEGSTLSENGSMTLSIDVDPEILEDFLGEAEEQLNTLENMMVDVEESPDPHRLNELYRAMHTLKGGFGFCNLDNCTDLTHEAEDLLDVLREEPPDQICEPWMDLLLSAVDVINVILSALQRAVNEDDTEPAIDISSEYFEVLKKDLHRAVEGSRQRDDFRSLSVDEAPGAESEGPESSAVRVKLDEIGDVVDLIGELVISHSELKEKMDGRIDRELRQTLNSQGKIINQLQERSMNMRMLPLKREFRKFPRVVRDLSQELGKDVELDVSGEQTELDKSVLDNLEGPLMHLVRNALDHGLETPEERKKVGKPPEGHLSIRAYHESGHVYIEIEDDGRGLPTDKIEETAIEKGLVETNHDLSDQQIHNQILRPGFSTADQVTDVSGRGVGMDVVATEVEQLRGNVLLDSEEGKGTKVTLELPLTVAIIDGLLTRIGDESFIIPVNQVEESINPGRDDLQRMQDRGKVINFRENVVPVIDPGTLMASIDPHEKIDDRTIMVVVRHQHERFAIWVDELLAHEQIVIKQINSPEIEDIDLTAGGAILGDGRVGLILDVAGMLRRFQEHNQTGASVKQS